MNEDEYLKDTVSILYILIITLLLKEYDDQEVME